MYSLGNDLMFFKKLFVFLQNGARQNDRKDMPIGRETSSHTRENLGSKLRGSQDLELKQPMTKTKGTRVLDLALPGV